MTPREDQNNEPLCLPLPVKRTLSAKDRAARTIPDDILERLWRRKNEQNGSADDPA